MNEATDEHNRESVGRVAPTPSGRRATPGGTGRAAHARHRRVGSGDAWERLDT